MQSYLVIKTLCRLQQQCLRIVEPIIKISTFAVDQPEHISMDTILLSLAPEFDTIRKEMGYDEYEDFDAYDIMFQQGYDRQMIEVADGETVEIPEGYSATIEGDFPDDEFYLLENEADLPDKENFAIDSLPGGSYRFDAAENIFWKIDMESSDSLL